MTHNELIKFLKSSPYHWKALKAVVELHRPYMPNYVETDVNEKGGGTCAHCSLDIKENSLSVLYPCPTIKVIEKELGWQKPTDRFKI